MAVELEKSLLNIVSEKWIKPSSPTPPSSRYYKFSALDVHMLDIFTPFVYLYNQKKESFHGGTEEPAHDDNQLFDLLETSLSKTLTYYYPFAGTFMDDNITVDCNDAGVQVWEVEIQAPMSEIVDNRDSYHPWNALILPVMFSSLESHAKFQLSRFKCGGICLVASVSHKLAEALGVANFVRDWAKITQDIPLPFPPILSGGSVFPPPPVVPNPTTKTVTALAVNSPFVTQRFLFPSSSISKLKEIVRKEIPEIQNPSQTEVVTILIFKSIISAAKRMNPKGFIKPCSLIQVANLRSLTIPPLSEQFMGNLVSKFVITVEKGDEEEKVSETSFFSKLVSELRKSKDIFQIKHRVCLDDNGNNIEFLLKYSEYWEESERKLIGDKYRFTSLIRFPFYETDFGFGKPLFVWIGGGLLEEVTGLMPTSNGNGMEAFVTLEKEKMSLFEKDEELLAYACVNPKICVL